MDNENIDVQVAREVLDHDIDPQESYRLTFGNNAPAVSDSDARLALMRRVMDAQSVSLALRPRPTP